VDTNTRSWFDVADDPDLSWSDKLGRYALMSDQYFEAEHYREFCATALASLPQIVYDWISSADFDALLVDTVRSTYPAHEHDRFLAHFRGLIGLGAAGGPPPRPPPPATTTGHWQVVSDGGNSRVVR
jgi:hypothetical protein